MRKKKLLKFMLPLAAAMLLFPSVASSQTLRGDFNMDGRVNISDVIAMANYLSTGTLGEVSPADRDTLTVNGVPFVMVRVKGGTYSLKYGKVRTIPDFWIGQTEVTCDLWWAVMGRDIYWEGTPGTAMRDVTWFDCQAFVDSLSRLTGRNFRLPYADEWRFAASGGTLTRGYLYSGSDDINEVAWHWGNSFDSEHHTIQFAVGTKAPNELGLYDMSGGVAELVQEMQQSTYGDGIAIYTQWAFGGCWHFGAEYCTPLSYFYDTMTSPDGEGLERQHHTGLRLAIPVSDEPWEFIEWPGSY